MANDSTEWNYLSYHNKLYTEGYTNTTNQSDLINNDEFSFEQQQQQQLQLPQNYSEKNDSSSGRLSYEGSSFMLLFEDFGEYFYNYNGTGYNETTNGLPRNCSLANSTCEEAKDGEFFTYISISNYFLNIFTMS
jgi:hypothetical protein